MITCIDAMCNVYSDYGKNNDNTLYLISDRTQTSWHCRHNKQSSQCKWNMHFDRFGVFAETKFTISQRLNQDRTTKIFSSMHTMKYNSVMFLAQGLPFLSLNEMCTTLRLVE